MAGKGRVTFRSLEDYKKYKNERWGMQWACFRAFVVFHAIHYFHWTVADFNKHLAFILISCRLANDFIRGDNWTATDISITRDGKTGQLHDVMRLVKWHNIFPSPNNQG
jgi:hypothetical protein